MNEKSQKMSLELIKFFVVCISHCLVDQTEVALKGWNNLLYEDKPVSSLCHWGYSIGYSGI